MSSVRRVNNSFRQASIEKHTPCDRNLKVTIAQDISDFLAKGGTIEQVASKCAPCGQRPANWIGLGYTPFCGGSINART